MPVYKHQLIKPEFSNPRILQKNSQQPIDEEKSVGQVPVFIVKCSILIQILELETQSLQCPKSPYLNSFIFETVSPQPKESCEQRMDMYDNFIQKGRNRHRISFRDKIDQNKGLKDIHIVENWASYNKKHRNQTSKCCSVM